jgi:DNA-binding MarR family transcriptional regulator
MTASCHYDSILSIGKKVGGGVTREQELLSALAKTAFRLNGQFLAIGEELARPAGLTAAWWLVLGAVLERPLTVADVAREMGVTRQSVQRIADVLIDRGLAEPLANPAHRRASLLSPTRSGRAAIRRIAPHHAMFARRLAAEHGLTGLERALDAATRLSDTLSALATRGGHVRATG